MLSTLRITNLAVVDELEVEFQNGLNIMTGETGSGKSVILRAIDLLAGSRAAADLVRHGEDRCTVEGVFIVKAIEELRSRLAEVDDGLADALESEEIIVRRVIEKSGRGKIYVNGGLTTGGSLQILGAQLIDITGQHQQQTLLDPGKHLELLDLFGVPTKLRDEMSRVAKAYFHAKEQLDSFTKDSAAMAAEIERWESELAELEGAGLSPGGRQAIEAELHRLSHAETLSAGIQKAMTLLEEDGESISTLTSEVLTVLERCAGIDPSFTQAVSLVESASAQFSETGIVLSQIGSRLEIEPEKIEELRGRVAEIARVERKYGKKEDALVEYRDSLDAKLKSSGGGELSLPKLTEEFNRRNEEMLAVAGELTKTRKRLAAELSQSVGKDLGRLGMKRAQFLVSLQPKAVSANGADTVEFLFSANPGEPPRGLHKVASGGELSRVLLVLKTLLNERNICGTQVFDEIDSGVSGAVSQVVGEKLLAVASKSQVILVTHSPQIASLADSHFLIEKSAGKDSTKTSIRLLDRPERIEHLAGMLAGKQVSTHFQKSAEELLGARAEIRAGK